MFQFTLLHDPMSEFRVIHCCWEPEPTSPSIFESDIQPPDPQPFQCCSWMSPWMCMRRKGHACDTAQRMYGWPWPFSVLGVP